MALPGVSLTPTKMDPAADAGHGDAPPPSPRTLATSSSDPAVVISRLEAELRSEQNKTKMLRAELKQAREQQVATVLSAEAHEEAITNHLLKRLQQLQAEKTRLVAAVEQEEEYLTNTLSKKLEAVRQEKVDLENQLEQEQEYIVNKLQKQLSEITEEKRLLEMKYEEEKEASNELRKLRSEISGIRSDYESRNSSLMADLTRLKTDNFVLRQKIEQEHEKLTQANREKTALEAGAELLAERQFNEMTRDGPGRFGRSRGRSFSLPPEGSADGQDQSATNAAHPDGSQSARARPPAGRVTLSENPTRRSPTGSVSEPTTPLAIPTSGRRRSSLGHGGHSPLTPSPHLSPRSSSKALKSGWMKYKSSETAPTELFHFVLRDSGLLEAFASDDFIDPNNTPVFTLHMDTIAAIGKHPDGDDTIVLKSNRGSDTHLFRCPSSDEMTAWIKWLEMLNPLANNFKI